ncbi:uncharacterized protein LOC121820762, partial [Ovis aries]|uniref:uncharacterized protein LOC121820762 n=1 Tax=Ovis aries TaxID=9940 RepID=UPI001C2EDA82
ISLGRLDTLTIFSFPIHKLGVFLHLLQALKFLSWNLCLAKSLGSGSCLWLTCSCSHVFPAAAAAVPAPDDKQPCQPPPVKCQEACAPKTKDPCAPQAKKQCPAKDTAIPAQQKCPATSKPPRVNRSKNGLRDTCPPTRLPDAAFSFSCSFSDPQLWDLPSSPIFSSSGSKETLSGFLPMEPLVSYIPLLPVYSSVPHSDSLLDEHE